MGKGLALQLGSLHLEDRGRGEVCSLPCKVNETAKKTSREAMV